MDNIPVNLGGYKLMITEEPSVKTRERDGQTEVVTDRDGVSLFVVSLFAKRRAAAGQRAGKGEEIKVTLTADPAESRWMTCGSADSSGRCSRQRCS